MDSAEDPLTGTLRDLKYDDRDLPLAKNYYDYVFNLVGKDSNPPWARQMWAAVMLFGEVCPRCSDPVWYNDIEEVPKDYSSKDFPEHFQFLEHGICPKCKTNKYELVKNYGLRNYKEGVLVWGQRSGKSRSAASMSSYHLHKFLKFPKFGSLTKALDPATPLTMTFVSLTFRKAFDLLWAPFMNMVDGNRWYDQYFELLDFYGNKYGKELYTKKKEFMKFFHKNLNVYPSHPNGPILRGDTRLGAVIDELGLFPLPTGNDDEDEQSARANADEAHKSLTNSLATVQSASDRLLKQGYFHAPTGLMLGVSSPMSRRDKVMRLLADSRTEEGKKSILGLQLPTWDVNPFMDRTDPIIVLAYKRNAAKAERDFGANPPRVHSTFVSEDVIKDGIFVGPKNSHALDYDFSDGMISGKLRRVANTNQPSLVTIDAGLNDNSFTFTSTYFDFNTGKTHTTTVLELIPQEGRQINFNSVYLNVIIPLIKQTNGKVLLADRWNSIDILHRAKHDIPGLAVQQFSVKRRHFDSVVKMFENKTAVLPRPELPITEVLEATPENYREYFVNKPVSHLAHQIITVKDTHPNKPPEKGDGYTDDILRAYVLGASMIHNEKIQKILQEARENDNKVRSSMPMPVFVSRGGMINGGIRR